MASESRDTTTTLPTIGRSRIAQPAEPRARPAKDERSAEAARATNSHTTDIGQLGNRACDTPALDTIDGQFLSGQSHSEDASLRPSTTASTPGVRWGPQTLHILPERDKRQSSKQLDADEQSLLQALARPSPQARRTLLCSAAQLALMLLGLGFGTAWWPPQAALIALQAAVRLLSLAAALPGQHQRLTCRLVAAERCCQWLANVLLPSLALEKAAAFGRFRFHALFVLVQELLGCAAQHGLTSIARVQGGQGQQRPVGLCTYSCTLLQLGQEGVALFINLHACWEAFMACETFMDLALVSIIAGPLVVQLLVLSIVQVWGVLLIGSRTPAHLFRDATAFVFQGLQLILTCSLLGEVLLEKLFAESRHWPEAPWLTSICLNLSTMLVSAAAVVCTVVWVPKPSSRTLKRMSNIVSRTAGVQKRGFRPPARTAASAP